jgi:hypothetical protein
MARLTNSILPDGGAVAVSYYTTGERKQTSGALTYPVAYSYDSQGRLKTMTNWSTFASGTGARVTTWNYDTRRGFLTNKVYDGNSGPIYYTNTLAGRLKARKWARAAAFFTTYTTNALGDIVGITYSDPTPQVTFNLDRLGRATNIIDGTGTNYLVYHDSGLVLSVTNRGGPLAGLSITNGYDAFLRRSQLYFRTNGSPVFTNTYGFDAASRMTNLSDGTFSAGYTFLANSPLIGQVAFRSNSTTRVTTTKAYDYLNRLQSISSVPSGASTLSSGYLYSDANQRTRNLQPDGCYWIYQYDSLGQVISGKKYWSDGTLVPGQQFEYAFDDIGNRTWTKAGGDSVG